MKKLLLATTMLVTAGTYAAADVSVLGDGRVGMAVWVWPCGYGRVGMAVWV